MTLFEIRTGWTGESYERMYVWDVDEDEARSRAQQYLDSTNKPSRGRREIVSIESILGEGTFPCLFELSDTGFGEQVTKG